MQCKYYDLYCNCVILSTNKGVKKTVVLFSHGRNKAFLVPDSCRVTVKNGNSINMDFTLKTIRMTIASVLFRQFGSCFGLFDIAG